MMTREQVLEIVEKQQIEFIRMEFLDYGGLTRGRTIRAKQLRNTLEKGINFSTAVMDFNLFDDYIPNHSYGANDGDFYAIPDVNTFAILPYRKNTARMLCDLVDENGKTWEGCPRNTLKRLLQEVETKLGGTLYMAFEQEAYLLKEVDGQLVPADHSHCFSTDGVDIQEDFIQNFVYSLEAMGVETEQISSEYGPGQLEINLKYTEALKAVDHQVTFMQLFKQVARDQGLTGTLMPKPFQHLPGSGLHVHMSLYNPNGENLFEDSSDSRGLGLSDHAYYFIGGLLQHAPSITALGAPSFNSFKRMQPGSWAPAHVCYGQANRSVLIRVPDKRRAKRFEYRGADGTCNPYLLAASLIAAGLHGVEAQIHPGEPAEIDVSKLSEGQLKERGITWLPRSLAQAVECLSEDTLLKDRIGKPIVEEFIKVKQSEIDKYNRYVSDWERQLFSEKF